MSTRADRHNNPTAFTTDMAKEAGLVYNTDYTQGDPFLVGHTYLYTAKLLKDPLQLTVQVIDRLGFYTKFNTVRWVYKAMDNWIWAKLNVEEKIRVIHDMYHHEGGIELEKIFE